MGANLKEMIELNREQYILAEPFIYEITCDSIYPCSIIEGNQQGRIFADSIVYPRTVLFWHYCGFAYIVGDTENVEFNKQIYRFLTGVFEENQRRFVLFVNDEKWRNIVNKMTEINHIIQSGNRIMFCFNKGKFRTENFDIPEEYEAAEIDANLLKRLQGKIIPSFSWHTPDTFFNAGKGFCLINKKNKDIACSSFSSCIANGKIDIGVETNPEYRRKGLGTIVAAQMVKYVLDKGYEPDWGCNSNNTGSASIARNLGFEEHGVHSTYIIKTS